MSQSYEYIFPVTKAGDIALDQLPVENVNLLLNGIYGNQVTNSVSLIANGFISKIKFNCTGDMSANTFIITGTQNGINIIEQLGGANATSVTSVNFYDMISSIKVTGNIIQGVKVEVSIDDTSGYFAPIRVNTEKLYSNVSYSLQFSCDAGAKYIIYQTLGDIYNKLFKDLIDNNDVIAIGNNAQPLVPTDFIGSQIIQLNTVCKNIIVRIEDTKSVTMRLQFLQL